MERRILVRTCLKAAAVAAAVDALALTVAHILSGGPAPITVVRLTPALAWDLPAGLSRWWDVIAAAGCAAFVTYTWVRRDDAKQEKLFGLPKYTVMALAAFFPLGLLAGTVGLLAAAAAPPAIGLVLGLILGLVMTKPDGVRTAAADGYDAATLAAAAVGLGAGVSVCFGLGLIVMVLAVPLAAGGYLAGYYLAFAAKFFASDGRRPE